ncbi:hypothetical protein P4052_04230 [Pseudomonas aeruginosa]|nr:hypothetical protein [Pseudomonas aeruginosa]
MSLQVQAARTCAPDGIGPETGAIELDDALIGLGRLHDSASLLSASPTLNGRTSSSGNSKLMPGIVVGQLMQELARGVLAACNAEHGGEVLGVLSAATEVQHPDNSRRAAEQVSRIHTDQK